MVTYEQLFLFCTFLVALIGQQKERPPSGRRSFFRDVVTYAFWFTVSKTASGGSRGLSIQSSYMRFLLNFLLYHLEQFFNVCIYLPVRNIVFHKRFQPHINQGFQ